MIKEWTENDPTLQRFKVLVRRKRLAPSTKDSYIKAVKDFTDFLEADTPEKAIEKLNGLTVKERTDAIDGYVSKVLDHATTGSCLQKVRGIKKWLMLNEVQMEWRKIQDEILPADETVVSDRMPTKEELKHLMNIGSLRDKTTILLFTSSGLRVGSLATLKLSDIQLEEEIPRIIVKRKVGRKISRKMKGFATFITPECKTMLLEYIKHRKNLGEKITEESPLITSDRQEELGNFLNSGYVSNHWRRLLKRSHLATKNGSPWHDLHLHTLRKYFATQCTNAGIKTAYREFWLGHRGGHMEESYFRGEVETHIEEYRKAIPYLSILSPEPQDYKALVEKVKFLEENGKRKAYEIQMLKDALKEKTQEIGDVKEFRDRLSEMENQLYLDRKFFEEEILGLKEEKENKRSTKKEG